VASYIYNLLLCCGAVVEVYIRTMTNHTTLTENKIRRFLNENDPLWAIVLSVLLRFTDSDYPFGIFKLFFGGERVVSINKILIYAHPDNIYISSVRFITSIPVYDEVALYIFVVDLGKVGCFYPGF
jgi:hypothetical protein